MTVEIIQQLLLGGLMGAVGQSIRAIVGLKKLDEAAKAQSRTLKDLFVASTMIVSLIIGFCAGVLAMVSISTFKPEFLDNELKNTLLGLVAAGYMGTDFIEGFMKKHTPGN